MDGILLVDKPIGMTSHDVVNIVRRAFHTKKVGHTGTLDPDASGLLVVGINSGTKIIQYLNNDDKTYHATIAIGSSTETLDKTGAVIDTKTVTNIDNFDEVLSSFKGSYTQTPPMYSAIKYNGTRLYEYARKGIIIDDIPSRTLSIYHIERTSPITYKDDHAYVDYAVSGSKGLYVRTLSYDIGATLGYPSHNYDLRRIQAGQFHIKDAYTIEQIKVGEASLLSLHEALSHIPFIIATTEMIHRLKHGMTLSVTGFTEPTLTQIINSEGDLLAIYEYDSIKQVMRAKQVFYKE